jgi:hypothetical protein
MVRYYLPICRDEYSCEKLLGDCEVKIMKRRFSLVLTLALCLTLVLSSCSKSPVGDTPPSADDKPAHVTPSPDDGQSVSPEDPLTPDTPAGTPDASPVPEAYVPETPEPDVPETPAASEAPDTPYEPDEQDEPVEKAPRLTPSDPGYLESKYEDKVMLEELTALVEGGALPWLIDEYFAAREREFLQRENILRLYPWPQRAEYGYRYSDAILDVEDVRVDGITNRIEGNWGNIKIVDAEAGYWIEYYTVEENGDIYIEAYEWTWFWYLCEGATVRDKSGFGTEHTLIVKVTEDGLELSEDLYYEEDMTGAGTIAIEYGSP